MRTWPDLAVLGARCEPRVLSSPCGMPPPFVRRWIAAQNHSGGSVTDSQDTPPTPPPTPAETPSGEPPTLPWQTPGGSPPPEPPKSGSSKRVLVEAIGAVVILVAGILVGVGIGGGDDNFVEPGGRRGAGQLRLPGNGHADDRRGRGSRAGSDDLGAADDRRRAAKPATRTCGSWVPPNPPSRRSTAKSPWSRTVRATMAARSRSLSSTVRTKR